MSFFGGVADALTQQAVHLAVRMDNPIPGSTGTPSLRPGLKDTDVGPGFVGFLVTFLVVIAVIFLILAMTRQIRRINHKAGADHQVSAVIRTSPQPPASSGEGPSASA